MVTAHPDDEVLLAGTIAACAQQGIEVTLVCATNGGGGAGSTTLGHRGLAELRRRELRAACDALGVHRLELLEDMAGGDEHLNRQNYAHVLGAHRDCLHALLAEVRPDAVVTFGPDGVTGHGTHVMVGRLADDAASNVADPARPALLHVAVTPSQWAEMTEWMAAHPAALAAYQRDVGDNPRVGPPEPELTTVPEEEASVVVDTTDVVERKRAAIACHASQGGADGLLGILAAPSTERFVPVTPVPSALAEIFAGPMPR